MGALPIVLDASTLDGGVRHGLVTFIVVLLVLAPAALGGTTVSLAARELCFSQRRGAADVGPYYAINTIGCAMGALVAGFLLMPLCGLRVGIVVVASIDVIAGLLVGGALASGRMGLSFSLTGSAVGLAAILCFLPPPILLKVNRKTDALLYYSESSEASVAVVRNRQTRDLTLLVGGDPQASSGVMRETHLRFLGHLPAL